MRWCWFCFLVFALGVDVFRVCFIVCGLVVICFNSGWIYYGFCMHITIRCFVVSVYCNYLILVVGWCLFWLFGFWLFGFGLLLF